MNKKKEKEEEMKKKMKEEYLTRKENNIVKCDCGTIYIAFREYHIFRHLNTNNHKNFINK
jgi:5'(3')-deoxyribonucleotidase